MTKRLPISVFIITLNEADRLPLAIQSVREWVDEVIVIDSGSTDSTVEVARSLGATVIYNPWQGYGPQKVFGEKQTRNEWVFNLDADEEVTNSLRDEIIVAFSEDGPAAFAIPWVDIPYLAQAPSRFEYKKRRLRLYNKSCAGFSESIVHDSVVVTSGKVQNLKNVIIHRPTRSYAHQIDKFNAYSTLQVQDMRNRYKKASNTKIVLAPFLFFLKKYIMKRFFMHGMNGFIESFIYAFARTMKYIKCRENDL